MSTPNPVNNELAEWMNGLDQRLKDLERARQPYQGDWVDLDNTAFSGGGTVGNRIAVDTNTYDIDDIFAVGDGIRYKKSGDSSYNYNYIVFKSSPYIYIGSGLSATGGSDQQFDDFGFSKPLGPIGFPVSFLGDFPMVFTLPASGLTDNGSQFYYSMIGSRVYGVLILDITLTGTPAEVRFETPFAKTSITDGGNDLGDNGGTTVYINGSFYRITWDTVGDEFVLAPADGSNWAAGSYFDQFEFPFYP